MSKELTEKWKDGTLETGDYYCRRGKFSFIGYPAYGMLAYRNHDSIEVVEEVLAPVPSYEELQKLKEQLKDANKVIKKYSDDTIYLFPTWYNGSRLAEAYLKKWGVK